jgi:hypothetical protein
LLEEIDRLLDESETVLRSATRRRCDTESPRRRRLDGDAELLRSARIVQVDRPDITVGNRRRRVVGGPGREDESSVSQDAGRLLTRIRFERLLATGCLVDERVVVRLDDRFDRLFSADE